KQIDGLSGASDAARDFGLTFTSAFEDSIVRGESFSKVLKSIEQDILRIITRMAVTEPLMKSIEGFDVGGLFSGLFGGGDATGYDTGPVDLGGSIADFLAGFRADGGPVSAGKRYVVGE